MPRYARPTRLDEALRFLARGRATILAGGTDFFPARLNRRLDGDVLDITAIAGLRGVRAIGIGWRIGAASTWTDIIAARLPAYFDALKLAAREVGGAQIQNTGTAAGNLCNASPAADGVPALLALDASVELRGPDGTRTLRLDEFVLGPRKTALRRDELVTAIVVPKPTHPAKSTFLKLGARRYLLISIAMVAAAVESKNGRVQAARVAVGACSPVARRLPALESALAGRNMDAALGDVVRPEHLSPLSPIDDLRADARYRREVALELVRRALRVLA
jgi:CO/xanthine dehydrogenase FAD-binding subunit